MLLTPHGGVLVRQYLEPEQVAEYQEQLPDFKKCILDEIEFSDLTLIANGAFSPLQGFNNRADYQGILRDSRLASGWVWPLPIVLSVSPEKQAEQGYRCGDPIALVTPDGQFQGIMELEEIYRRDREREAIAIFGTADRKHPGVDYLFSKGEIALGGTIKAKPVQITQFPEYELTPLQTRAEFARRGWQSVVAFQTRNPIHRAHEYLQKVALESVDGLFIHPLVGFTKPGDIPAAVRMRCYQALLAGYYPAGRVLLAVFPAAMRYAGPKEAVFHALVRKNYGCSHFIVGRDHAGVGNYYGTYDAQNIFEQFSAAEIGITILKYENTFYCKRCGNMASAKTCPHSDGDLLYLSGTKVREMLSDGLPLPAEFTRPEIAAILMEFYQSQPLPV
jgi:sulfate adenylyltransferase